MLAERGEHRLSIAGIVIGCFAIGGIAYSLAVSRLLTRFGQKTMMFAGALLMAAQLGLIGLGVHWSAQVGLFFVLGFAFYMLHGSLQVFATELAPEARASAASLHAFSFFLGQALGPLYYGYALSRFGEAAAFGLAALVIAMAGVLATRVLTRRHQAAT
jgi:MFS family permease